MISSADQRSFLSSSLSQASILKKKGAQLSIIIVASVSLLCALIGGGVLGVAVVDAHQTLCVDRASSALLCKIMPSSLSSVSSVSALSSIEGESDMLSQARISSRGPLSNSSDNDRAVVDLANQNAEEKDDALSEQQQISFARIKPILIELGVVAVVHSLGVNLARRTGSILAKLPWDTMLRRARTMTKGSYYFVKKVYKKTHASKITTRVKKQVKHALHHNKNHHHHDHHHSEEESLPSVHH